MKNKITFFAILLFTVITVNAQIPNGYYDTAQGLTGDSLRSVLSTIIDEHTEKTYTELWTSFKTTDIKANGKVWDMYSTRNDGTANYEYEFITNQCGNYSGEGYCYNREHSFPKSWFNNGTPMYTDLFHLYPTDGYTNGKRSNYPFGEVGSTSWLSSNGSKLGTSSYPGYSGTVFEPIDEYKGDFARSYFYMLTRYKNQINTWHTAMLSGDNFSDWAKNMLLEWAEQDPVSEKEINRNNAVYKIQHNRNPFIDHPEWKDAIWGDNPCADYYFDKYQVVCEGESFNWHSTNYTETGVYEILNTTVNGCDSNYVLTFIVDTNDYYSYDTINLCSNDEYTFLDGTTINDFDSTVTHINNISTIWGCDSTVETTLIVNRSYLFEDIVEICGNETYTWQDSVYAIEDIYEKYYLTSTGCDSIYQLYLLVYDIDTTIINVDTCGGNPYIFDNTEITESGTYYKRLTSIQTGCDSIIQLNITIQPIYTNTSNFTICEGNTYTWRGLDLTENGTYYDTIQNQNTCDSCYILNLTVDTNIYYDEETVNVLIGSNYTFPDSTTENNITTTVVHISNLTTVWGCDSIIKTTLQVVTGYLFEEEETICEGSTFNWQGGTYTDEDIYEVTYTSINQTDSTYLLYLYHYPVDTTIVNTEICENDSIFLENSWQQNSGIYYDILTSQYDCDSIIETHLEILPLPTKFAVNGNGTYPYGGAGIAVYLSDSEEDKNYTLYNVEDVISIEEGTGSQINFGNQYAGTYTVYAEDITTNCGVKMNGYATIVEQGVDGTAKIVANITYGINETLFYSGEVNVALYKEENDMYGNTIILEQSNQILPATGQIEFNNLDEGIYYLKSSIINPDNYDVVPNIFYINSLTADSADAIILFENDIFTTNLNHWELNLSGSNTAGGTVNAGTNAKSVETGSAMPDQVVILRNEIDESILAVEVTDANGEYNFNYIPDNGEYQIYLTSFEYQTWTPAFFSTSNNNHYTFDFIIDTINAGAELVTTNIKNIELTKDVKMFPNPTKNNVYISSPKKVELSIFSIDGKKIITQKNFLQGNIDLSNFTKGVYIVILSNTNSLITKKLIIN